MDHNPYRHVTKIAFFDTETTIHNVGDDAVGKHKASPFCPSNEIVYTGYTTNDVETCSIFPGANATLTHCELLVAQNIAFDLEHLLVDEDTRHDMLEWAVEGKLWDVMIVEYLLTGQELTWASLDELARIYGGELKDSRIKEYWESGISTEDIPPDEIIPYLVTDVQNLKIIYEGQFKAAERLGMLPLIHEQMEARLATIIMEVNGMYFDKKTAHKMKEELKEVRDELHNEVVDAMFHLTGGKIPKDQLNPASNLQVSACLFGGEMKYTSKEAVLDHTGEPVRYKTGKRKGEAKTKNMTFSVQVYTTLESPNPIAKTGYYPVGDKVLKGIDSDFCRNLIKLREYNKQINTYFDGYSSLVFPDGLIHGNLNHCQTATGRLSSSAPNLQNISNKASEVDKDDN